MTRLLGIAVAFLGALTVAVWLTAGALSTALERQTTYRYIADALAATPEPERHVAWRPAAAPLVRPFTEADEILIGRALHEAWQILAVAQDTGDSAILSDRFSGVALERATLSVADGQAHGGRLVVLSQTARPAFFHKDGSLFQAEVEMVVARYLGPDDTLDAYELTRETGVATLMNESNGWRLYSYERRTAAPLEPVPAPWSGTLWGFNYYPADTPWRDFWPEYDSAVTATDFAQIADLGGESIRIFLTREDFLADDHQDALARLADLLALAHRQGLTVIPTLFDLKQDYSLGGWGDDSLYLDRVLPVLAAAPGIAFVDLKNEPDLDFVHHGEAKVTAWLKSMGGLIRDRAPGLSLTIGWSNAGDAARLLGDLDVITYHDYAAAGGVADRLADVRRIAGAKPVLVTEIGESSYGALFGMPGSETRQADALIERLDALQAADGAFIWTLHDFAEVDGTVVGQSPWVKRLQSAFGVLRSDGTEKPSAAAIRRVWTARDLSEQAVR